MLVSVCRTYPQGEVEEASVNSDQVRQAPRSLAEQSVLSSMGASRTRYWNVCQRAPEAREEVHQTRRRSIGDG